MTSTLRKTTPAAPAEVASHILLIAQPSPPCGEAALHIKSRAVIDRPYNLRSGAVGALYERPRSLFCAKPLLAEEGGCANKVSADGVVSSAKSSGLKRCAGLTTRRHFINASPYRARPSVRHPSSARALTYLSNPVFRTAVAPDFSPPCFTARRGRLRN